ncbi:MAG: oligosaccharide flippase family protein [Chlamydiales bacterium]
MPETAPVSHPFRRLLQDLFIYSGGQVLSRLITFLLLPLTTAYLTPADYGVISTLSLIVPFLVGLYTLGAAAPCARLYHDVKTEGERREIIWTAFSGLTINAAIWTSLAALFSSQISLLLFQSSLYSPLVILIFVSTALTHMTVPLISSLRMKEKAPLIAAVALFETLLSVALTLYFIIFLKIGVLGIVLSWILSQLASFLATLFICLKFFRFKVGWKYVPQMLQLGLPYAITLIGYPLLQSASRAVMQFFLDMNEVGLFYMGSNFARCIELPVIAFINAWVPFYASFANRQEEGIPLFRKVLSYYVLALCALCALFFAAARPVVCLILHANFHSIWTVVGILSLAQGCWGIYHIFIVGLFFNKKALWQLYVELSAGAVSVLINCALIPLLNKEGAAIATLISFAFLAGITYLLSQRLLPIQYEWNRIIKICAGLIPVIGTSFLPLPLYFHMAVSGCLVLLYYAFLWKFCLTRPDKQAVLRYIRRDWAAISTLKENL